MQFKHLKLQKEYSITHRTYLFKSLVQVEIIKGREKVGLLWVGLIAFQILRVN